MKINIHLLQCKGNSLQYWHCPVAVLPSVQCPVSSIQCPVALVSSVQCPVSSVQCPVSSVQCPVSSCLQYLLSSANCRVVDTTHSGETDLNNNDFQDKSVGYGIYRLSNKPPNHPTCLVDTIKIAHRNLKSFLQANLNQKLAISGYLTDPM